MPDLEDMRASTRHGGLSGNELQIGRLNGFGEALVDRREENADPRAPLIAPEPAERRRRMQLQQSCAMSPQKVTTSWV